MGQNVGKHLAPEGNVDKKKCIESVSNVATVANREIVSLMLTPLRKSVCEIRLA